MRKLISELSHTSFASPDLTLRGLGPVRHTKVAVVDPFDRGNMEDKAVYRNEEVVVFVGRNIDDGFAEAFDQLSLHEPVHCKVVHTKSFAPDLFDRGNMDAKAAYRNEENHLIVHTPGMFAETLRMFQRALDELNRKRGNRR